MPKTPKLTEVFKLNEQEGLRPWVVWEVDNYGALLMAVKASNPKQAYDEAGVDTEDETLGPINLAPNKKVKGVYGEEAGAFDVSIPEARKYLEDSIAGQTEDLEDAPEEKPGRGGTIVKGLGSDAKKILDHILKNPGEMFQLGGAGIVRLHGGQ